MYYLWPKGPYKLFAVCHMKGQTRMHVTAGNLKLLTNIMRINLLLYWYRKYVTLYLVLSFTSSAMNCERCTSPKILPCFSCRNAALLRSAVYPVTPPQMLSRVILKTLVGPEVMTFRMSRLLELQLWLFSPPHKVRTQEEVNSLNYLFRILGWILLLLILLDCL